MSDFRGEIQTAGAAEKQTCVNLQSLMNRLCIIIPYFGKKWPPYFRFYCHSLKNNPLLDVLLFTDIEEPIPGKPGNLIVRKMDLQELKSLITRKTGIGTNFSGTRKLCDLKPTYGHLFEDYLSGYEFWGYGDIDVIYGNLSKFINDKILSLYDLITFREDWISGAFTLVRNNQTGKLLYRKSADYYSLLEDENYRGFDECGSKFEKLRDREDILTMTDDFQCWSFICYKAQEEGILKIYAREYIKESLPFDEILTYTNKSILGSGHKHYALYHHVTHKSSAGYFFPAWNSIPDQYYITTTGIYSRLGIYFFLMSRIRKANAFYYRIRRRIKDSLIFRTKSLRNHIAHASRF